MDIIDKYNNSENVLFIFILLFWKFLVEYDNCF